MIYEPLPGGDGRPYFQCCGLIICHPPQAAFHLWCAHGEPYAAAWEESARLQDTGHLTPGATTQRTLGDVCACEAHPGVHLADAACLHWRQIVGALAPEKE